MRFQFVVAQKANYPVNVLCQVMQVSRSGFYAWNRREPSARACQDESLLVTIKSEFNQSRQTYGSPRVHASLRRQGHSVGVNRVSRLMRDNGLSGRTRRKYRCTTTQTDPNNPVSANKLDRDFQASAPNEKWVTDVTFVRTQEGWLYLAPMIDLFNREVVGWAMSDQNDTELTLRALDMALTTHKPPKGLLHHSDRGSSYTAGDYREALAKRGIQCSMSRKANCWDNSVAESFFATIKKDMIHRRNFKTRREAATAIFEYIEVFYNRVRLHSVLGYTSPAEFRHAASAADRSA